MKTSWNKNQVKYLRALDAWIEAGHPAEGPMWEEYQAVWETLTLEEQEEVNISRDLSIPDPSERFDEYEDYGDKFK